MILNDLEVADCIVSIDAMGCQKEIAKDIVARRADYVLALKQNQPKLLAAVETAFSKAGRETPRCAGKEVGHGRVEERDCAVLEASLLPGDFDKAPWAGFASLVRIKAKRAVLATAEVSEETRYYISSLNASPLKFAGLIRGHWGIENNLHGALDVILGEDASRKRTRNAAANFGTILRIALNLLNASPETISLKRKIKKAARSDEYRAVLLRIK